MSPRPRSFLAHTARVLALGLFALLFGLSSLNAWAQASAGIVCDWATHGFGSVALFAPCATVPETMCESEPGVWTGGELYNPDDGRTYTSVIRFVAGTLELRGCALSVFCDTQIWRRPEDVLQAVRGL